MYRVAEKLLKSKTGERTKAPPGSYRRDPFCQNEAHYPHHPSYDPMASVRCRLLHSCSWSLEYDSLWACFFPQRSCPRRHPFSVGISLTPSCVLRSLFMSTWISLQIHDWFFHDFTDDEPWTLKYGPGKKDTFKLRRTIIDEDGHALNTETPW